MEISLHSRGAILIFILNVATGASAADYNEELSRIGRQLTSCLSGETRLKVAAVDFTDLRGEVTELGRLLAEELSTELSIVGGSAGPQVVDRNHLATVLREHELNASGLVHPETAKELGQFAGIDVVVTGNVLALENTIRMTVKAITTESATITCAARGEFPKTIIMREMLGSGLGSHSRSDGGEANGATEGELAAVGAVTTSKSGMLGVSLKAFTKRRDGREVHIALGVTNRTERDLGLLLNSLKPPLLIDNIGSEWKLVRAGGLPTESLEGSKTAITAIFSPNAEQIITLVFESESSAGKTFSVAGILAACRHPSGHCHPGSFVDFPIGLANIDLR